MQHGEKLAFFLRLATGEIRKWMGRAIRINPSVCVAGEACTPRVSRAAPSLPGGWDPAFEPFRRFPTKFPARAPKTTRDGACAPLGCRIDKHPVIAWLWGVRAMKVPESGAKRKMFDAAVSLVAEKGFDSVSIRDVTGAAKANVAAVNYHFGSREGMMDLLIIHILEPLCSARLNALDEAERRVSGKMISVEETVRLFVLSLNAAALQPSMDASLFFKLTGRTLVLPDEALPPQIAELRHRVSVRFLDAITRALPHTSSKELSASWNLLEAGLGQSLIEENAEEIANLMERWIAFGVRGLGEISDGKRSAVDDSQGMLFEF